MKCCPLKRQSIYCGTACPLVFCSGNLMSLESHLCSQQKWLLCSLRDWQDSLFLCTSEKRKSVSSDKRFLMGAQFASKPRGVAVAKTRLKHVSTLNVKEFFLVCNHSRFFPWNIRGLFNLKGKATIWGLISPKESSVAVDDLDSLGKVSALPITKCIKRQCPPSSSAVFLESANSCSHLLSIFF